MFRTLPVLTVFLGLLACPPASQADASMIISGFVEATGFGTVDANRTRNPVQARLLAKRAAMVDAQRNLLEMIEGVRVTSGTTVRDAQLESDVIANRVKGLLKGAFVLNESTSKEAGTWLAEVTLGICITAAPEKCGARPNLAQIIYPLLPETPEAGRFQGTSDAPGATSVIVDLTGHGFEPYFSIRLVDAAGKVIYGPDFFKRKDGADWLHWEKSLASARVSEHAGKSPLIVPAEGTTLDSDIILSDRDAAKLYSANIRGGDFLGQGKVILVTD